MAIQKILFNSVELANKQGKKLMSVPLQDGRSAKILFNDKAVDCYIVNKGNIEEARGVVTSKENLHEEIGCLFEKLEGHILKGFNIWAEYANALVRNVK